MYNKPGYSISPLAKTERENEDYMGLAITEKQKARLFDLGVSVMELTRDGNRDCDEVICVLQAIKDHKDFAAKLQAPTTKHPQPTPPPLAIVINANLDPTIPSGLCLTGKGTEHRKMGQVTLEKRPDGKLYANGTEVVRHRVPGQMNGTIQGHKLRKELEGVQVLNACIMDALLANPELIPDEWKTGYTYFWGTIFRRADGNLCVGYLCWHDDRWDWGYRWLDGVWGGQNPAAALAS